MTPKHHKHPAPLVATDIHPGDYVQLRGTWILAETTHHNRRAETVNITDPDNRNHEIPAHSVLLVWPRIPTSRLPNRTACPPRKQEAIR